jgi:hypothetical protein
MRRTHWFDPLWPRLIGSDLRHGLGAVRQAVAGGQFEYAKGLFFGGKEPARTHLLVRRQLPQWVGDAQAIIHFDVHSGLGPWGKLQLLLERRHDPGKACRLAERFGPALITLPTPIGRSPGAYYAATGELGAFCSALFPDRRYDALCAEFGTYSALKVLAALRAENQAYHWEQDDAATVQRTREHLQEVFTPADQRWRETIVGQGMEMMRQAREVLTGTDA